MKARPSLRLIQAQLRRLMQAPAHLKQARLVWEAKSRKATLLKSRLVEARPLLRLNQAQQRRLRQAPARPKQARLLPRRLSTWSLPRREARSSQGA